MLGIGDDDEDDDDDVVNVFSTVGDGEVLPMSIPAPAATACANATC